MAGRIAGAGQRRAEAFWPVAGGAGRRAIGRCVPRFCSHRHIRPYRRHIRPYRGHKPVPSPDIEASGGPIHAQIHAGHWCDRAQARIRGGRTGTVWCPYRWICWWEQNPGEQQGPGGFRDDPPAPRTAIRAGGMSGAMPAGRRRPVSGGREPSGWRPDCDRRRRASKQGFVAVGSGSTLPGTGGTRPRRTRRVHPGPARGRSRTG